MYRYETEDNYDLDWSREIVNKIKRYFDDEDIITEYSEGKIHESGYGASYDIYYLTFDTENYKYKLELNEELSAWVLSSKDKELVMFSSGLSGIDDGNGDNIYRIEIDIKELVDWIIEEVKKFENVQYVKDEANEIAYKFDDFLKSDQIKIIKILMNKWNISKEDL